ncbi:hypothetical protein VC83_00229 [Pseudogymnoascus destructans]|uniref:DUF7582 domain-containing protein n=2 Tax=Pseudogymnoascus destructans TaxID=655981 RepID=L8GC14_PSED2|nr:uncharacterized protein VC83_00229 [Pseudogymnoascus destructans]ELR10577.1 hypothetical protein GMDG_04850 [Pseudogymnoascus destructans 20631-21]OAF62895.1 hypothetical protein VC83_00229 [Pseudogymnoascus destructans]
MRWLLGYDCSSFSTVGLFCCVDDKDAASTTGFCCRYGEKASITQSIPKITLTTAEQPRTRLHPLMIATRQSAQTRQQSSIAPPQPTATLTVPVATGRKHIQPEMAQSQFMPTPLLPTATLRMSSTATNQGVTTPRLDSTAQHPWNRQRQSSYEQPREPIAQRQLPSRKQLPSYNMPPTQRQLSTRQRQPPYDNPSSARQPSPRQQPSSQGLLVTQQPTDPEQIAALNLKLETYRQIIVDLMRPTISQQVPAVSAEQIRTSLRKAVSNPQPRTTATPYPDTPPYSPPPKQNAASQSQINPERFELPATSLQQSRPVPRIITTPPYVYTNPYRNKRSELSAATGNHHRTISQPQMERSQWPSTPDLSEAPSRTLSGKEVPKSEPPRQARDSNDVPVPPGCCILDRRAIERGLGLMAQYLHQNNADLTIIAVGGVVSAFFLGAWTTSTDVDALGSTLTTAQRRLLASAALHAKSRGPVRLGDGWFSGESAKDMRPEVARDVYELSKQQNDIVYCSEGLTVLAPRWSYAFMVCVDRLSRGVGRPYDMGNAVLYMHQYIKIGKHKLIPILGIMKWGEGYGLHVTMEVLRVVKAQYLRHYDREAISE